MKKILLLLFAALMGVVNVANAEDTELWSGTQDILGWNNVQVKHSDIADKGVTAFQAGDKITITISATLTPMYGYRQIALRGNNTGTDIEGGIHMEDDVIGDFSFIITGDMLPVLNIDGIEITGDGYTITKITHTSTSTIGSDNSIWIGSTNWGDWGTIHISPQHLRNAKSGDLMYVRYTKDNPSDLYFRYAYDYSQTDFDPQPTRNVEDTYEYIVLTDDIISQWVTNGKQIYLKGKNYTISSIELIEGNVASENKVLYAGDPVVCAKGSYASIGEIYGPDKFYGYKVGDVIAITTSASGTSGYVQILSVGYTYIKSKSFSEAGVVEFELTKEILDYAKTIGLRIQADDCTVEKAELKTKKESVSISTTSGYVSFCSDRPLDFSEVTGLEAYIVSNLTSSAATLTKVTEAPANTGLILKGSAGETYNIPVVASATVGTNKLKAAVTATDVTANSTYVLSDGQFKKFTGTSIPAGKAYLLAEDIPAEAHELSLNFGDATGIKNIKVGTEDNVYYDLQGRRVLYPTKGLYIVNGKKVIVK